ncbi:hypothetical protein NG791_09015 [Laspinema sp. D1]|uniref:hypothetical protein n=1 Tax=Laspinema palackyanum TaxID=3231601 RepID=UPI0034811E6B|nr:hypothetical protein [Laspinema sp. D2b]
MSDGEILDLTGLEVNQLNLPQNGRSPAWNWPFRVNLPKECDRDRTPICSNLTNPLRSKSLTGSG